MGRLMPKSATVIECYTIVDKPGIPAIVPASARFKSLNDSDFLISFGARVLCIFKSTAEDDVHEHHEEEEKKTRRVDLSPHCVRFITLVSWPARAGGCLGRSCQGNSCTLTRARRLSKQTICLISRFQDKRECLFRKT